MGYAPMPMVVSLQLMCTPCDQELERLPARIGLTRRETPWSSRSSPQWLQKVTVLTKDARTHYRRGLFYRLRDRAWLAGGAFPPMPDATNDTVVV